MKIGLLLITGAVYLVAASPLHAQVPQLINYQGRVLAGTTNFDGGASFKFALVNAAGNTTYWSNDGTSTNGNAPQNAVPLIVSKGLYSVLLGDASLAFMTAIPASVFNNADVRLRVWFDDGTHGSQRLTPDQRIASVGYAMTASNVPDGSITGAKIASTTITSTNIANGAIGTPQLGNSAVGSANIANGAIGTPQLGNNAVSSANIASGAVGNAQLAVNTVATTNLQNNSVTAAKIGLPLSLSGSGPNILSVTSSDDTAAVFTGGGGGYGVRASGGLTGVYGSSSSIGVRGESTSSTGSAGSFTNTAGGYSLVANGFLSLEGARTFIHGFDGSGGTGNHWFSNGTPANPDGDLIMALHRNGTNNYDLNVNGSVRGGESGTSSGFLAGIDPQFTQHVGVYGESDQQGVVGHGTTDGATGVFGNSTAHGGFGVRGETNTGVGVQGQSFGAYSSGVSGIGDASNGTGVYGRGGVGVYGSGQNGVGGAAGAAGAYGIVGYDWSGGGNPGHAAFFSGAVQVNGSFTVVGSKNFKMDHPLDPANKYLTHSCVESPDVKNIYDGTVTTNANGDATVTLPSYFEALNRDFRYQLTVIGQFAQAIVASEIKDNAFTIKTDRPSVKISWQVTGIRQDAYMKAHPLIVEEDKPPDERGTYQQPELYGQPEEMGLQWKRNPELMRRLKAEQAKRAKTTTGDSAK